MSGYRLGVEAFTGLGVDILNTLDVGGQSSARFAKAPFEQAMRVGCVGEGELVFGGARG